MLAAACRTDPARTRAILLKAARQELAAGQPARAAIRLKRILQMDARDADANFELGRALLAQADVYNAAWRFRRALEADPGHDGAQVELARLVAVSGDARAVEDARARLRQMLDRRPGDPNVTGALGLLEWRAGELASAAALLEQATAAHPEAERETLALAHLRAQAGNPAEAERLLRAQTHRAGAAWSAHLALGEFLRGRARWAEAEAAYRDAVRLAPDAAAPAAALAGLLDRQGPSGEAAALWKQLSRRREPQFHTLYAAHLARLGRRAEALAELEDQCRRFPQDRLLRQARYQELRTQQRTADLRALIEDVLRSNPREADALLERARLHAQAGRWAEAGADANEVLRFQPSNATALYLRSKMHQHAGRTAERKQALSAALDADPRLLPARLELAGLVASASAKTALEILDAAPPAQRASPAWRLERNWTLVRSAQWDRLEVELSAYKPPAGWHAFAVQRGLLALARHDYASARTSVESLLQEHPGDLVGLDIAVRSLAAQQRLADAGDLIARQAERAGHPPALADFQARFLLAQGRGREARQILEQAVRRAPDFASAQILLAQLESEAGQPAAASARLEAVSRTDPRRVDLWLAWGDALVRRNQPEAALATYKKALELQPGNPLALNNIAHLTAEVLGRPDDALPYALKARETGAGIAAVNHTLGWILCRRGMWSAAVPHLEQARAQHAEPQVTYRLAIAYAKTGNYNKGRQMFDEASRLDPRLPEAREARAALHLTP